jgi:hypothetical protein
LGSVTVALGNIITFDDDDGASGGTISYDGAGGALIGTDILFNSIIGKDTPLNDGTTLVCTGL